MILRSEDLKEICSKILGAVDTTDTNIVNETLSIETIGEDLFISVTNREYFAKVKLHIGNNEQFIATVNANTFLKLISQITSDTVELEVNESNLKIKANGTYNLPLIFDGKELLRLPTIEINNITSNQIITKDILSSILNYNSKEILKEGNFRPVQRMYYVDGDGCITFTSGACVNSFKLDSQVKFLLKDKIVKLFKLFNDDNINFYLGHDAISNDIMQTKVRFEDSSFSITAIVPDDASLINSVPVAGIRKRAENIYPYSITFDKNSMLQAISRFLIFIDTKIRKPMLKFTFNKNYVSIIDDTNNNVENIYYNNDTTGITDDYIANIDLVDLKLSLDNCREQYIQMYFGDNQAIIIKRNNIINVIPEC